MHKFTKLIAIGLAATLIGTSQVSSVKASIFGWFDNFELTLESKTKGLPLTISTYDFDGQKIDQVKTKSADIHTDRTMSKTDSDGNEQSSVIDVDYGNKRMTHVGSTLIAYEGMKNYEDQFSKHVNIDDHQKSVPLLNSMYQDFSNQWNSKAKVVMIRSQSGKPIAVFTGNEVSIHQTEMKNATKFVINGHRLFAYRCDYTVYPMSSIKDSVHNKVIK
ncbi:DUF5052 family protein [Limosilactobacillus reuteri]|uniref:DUF5052 family protein n=1 Tax=Limosilactobacillus reuteri TaxID=1598 RepID=A0AAW4X6U3_LIMRT|nr:DUF5052 family protein [Limosilactobacillus reuteri]MCC4478048.1 DUF5052 family protein [Limosilactobacillus reuteri]MCC4479177.1 DUF5052 family protein [Limosilactobacillus reuteri]MCC4488368.1 DUF5052 family protein [Limosilactobacillus reuteri]MCC4492923.1 DUF5052 family protein [Limosilactobacillus reuteri]MCC4496373.1 DUF5052 family protein [Limosilactobacillus reuteri]